MNITPYDKNAKKHPKKQIEIEQVANSIKEFGMNQPIVVDKNGVIIVGHGRYEALKHLKWTDSQILEHVKVVDLTEEQANAYRLADNKLNESDWDMKLVLEELKGLSEPMLDLTGFDRDLVIEPDEKDDEVPEIPEEPKSKLGDLYELGEHRVLCGDSTQLEAVLGLCGGKKVDMVFTDPPYGINLDGDNSKRGSDTSLMKGGLKLKSFVDDSTSYAVDAYNLCQGMGIPIQIWWGANYYIHSLPQTNNWLIWDKRVEEKMTNTNSDGEMAWVQDGHSSVRIFRHLWNGLIKGSEQGQKRVHPTQKPIELGVWCFNKYAPNSKTVLDLFGGSGSTLIASEKTGRNAFLMELDPHYVDVIVQRYVDYTGNENIKLNGKDIIWKKKQTQN